MNATHQQPVIWAKGVSRVYLLGAASVIGINRINLDVKEGELVVLKGNSGSGKSTLLALLAGLDFPSEGELRVAGYTLTDVSPKQLACFRREIVGMVFQSFNLLPTLNVLENICLPALLAGKTLETAQSKASALLDWLDLKPRHHHFPGQLSGGEMQRTAIARALINDPPIVLADEPTGNLDSRNGQMVIDLLVELNHKLKRTVFIATHSKLADRVATMRINLRDGMITNK